jgi:hypothetical protein
VSKDDSNVIKTLLWKKIKMRKQKNSKILINDLEIDLLKEENILLFEGIIKDNTNLARKNEIIFIINLLEIIENDLANI